MTAAFPFTREVPTIKPECLPTSPPLVIETSTVVPVSGAPLPPPHQPLAAALVVPAATSPFGHPPRVHLPRAKRTLPSLLLPVKLGPPSPPGEARRPLSRPPLGPTSLVFAPNCSSETMFRRPLRSFRGPHATFSSSSHPLGSWEL